METRTDAELLDDYVSMAADTGATPEARPTAASAGGLTVEVNSKSATFAPDEGLRFVVTFSNPSRADVPLEIMQFLQSETAGTYTSRFRNRATGETWQPWQNPNVPAVGAPARITKESLKAGGKREEVHRDVQVRTPRDRSRRDLDRGR